MTLIKVWREQQRQKDIFKKKIYAGFQSEVTIAATSAHYLRIGEKQINKTWQRSC